MGLNNPLHFWEAVESGSQVIEGVERVTHRRIAILFGWDKYDFLSHLEAPLNDIALMKKVLADVTMGAFEQIFCLDSGAPSSEIGTQMEEILTQEAEPEDTILVYFSGHGKLDQMGRLYLALRNTKESALDSTSLSVERLRNYAERSRSRSIILILDCCYSGAVSKALKKGELSDQLSSMFQGTGIAVVTSSTGSQVSLELSESLSLFTKVFAEGISNGYADTDDDGLITLDEAYSYAYNAVRSTGLQHPMKFGLDLRGTFVLAKNPRFKKWVRPDPRRISAAEFKKFSVIDQMASSVQRGDGIGYFVVLAGYWIEGCPYSASGLSVDEYGTPNFRQTEDGFECDTFFPPHMIQPVTVAQNGITKKDFGQGPSEVVRVRMKVMSKDILGVSAYPDGVQTDLFMEDGAAFSRLTDFHRETQKWFQERNRAKEEAGA